MSLDYKAINFCLYISCPGWKFVYRSFLRIVLIVNHYSQLNVLYFGYTVAHAWNGSVWNNLLFNAYYQISLNVKCMFGLTCHWYCNGFYSKETGVYNNYCYYFQISLWLILPTAWNTNFVSQGKWFCCSRSNVGT